MSRTSGDRHRRRSFSDWIEQRTVLSTACAMWIGIAFVTGLCFVGVDLIQSVGILIGWWSGNPRWYAAVGVVATVVMGVRLMYGKNERSDREFWKMFTAGAAVITVGIVTLAGWVGWLATIAIVMASMGAVTFLAVRADRREHAVREPYASRRQPDDETLAHVAILIAPVLLGGGVGWLMWGPVGAMAFAHGGGLLGSLALGLWSGLIHSDKGRLMIEGGVSIGVIVIAIGTGSVVLSVVSHNPGQVWLFGGAALGFLFADFAALWSGRILGQLIHK